jgi:heme/copper-type cytochrome/quinol oxidase subunit 3
MDGVQPSRVTSVPSEIIPSDRLAGLLFIAAETVLFSSFIGSYLVLRFGADHATAPRPSVFLVVSAWIILLLGLVSAQHAARSGRQALGVALAGLAFVTLQTMAFWRTGPMEKTSAFAVLLLMVGAHAVHVLAGSMIALRPNPGRWLLPYWAFLIGVGAALIPIAYGG